MGLQSAVLLLPALASGMAVVGRRSLLLAATTEGVRCRDIETCREVGDLRAEEAERRAGPTVSLAGGVKYREMEPGKGPVLAEGDSADITFQVLQSASGYFMYGVPNREPGSRDLSETYRVTLGNRDVPSGVELALLGASKGTRRRVQLPRASGFESSDWKPEPTTFAGQQRIKRFQNILYGNGLQPGYDAQILFEFEVVRVKKR